MTDPVPDRAFDIEALSVPFPREALKTRRGDGKALTYVEGHSIINRLNAATKNQWSFEIRSIDSAEVGLDKNNNPRLLWKVRGALTIPTCGTRESIGVQIASLGTGEDLIKGAVTDCIKKCATLFGVGIELYGPDYEDDGERVDRHTGEITAPVQQPARQAPVAAQPAQPSPRDEAAKTTWTLAQSLGLSRPVLDAYAKEKLGKTPEQCDVRDLMKLCNALKAERDIPAMIDVLTNKPKADQPALMQQPVPTPLRTPDRYTN
jgi:hypothetical protein